MFLDFLIQAAVMVLRPYIKAKRYEQSGVPSLEKGDTDNLAEAEILNDHFHPCSLLILLKLNHFLLLKVPPLQTCLLFRLKLMMFLIYDKSQILIKFQAFLLDFSRRCFHYCTSSRLFNASLAQGQLPLDWKSTFATPVYKKGSRANPSNYCPISLTCICCKIFEHIISSSIINHLNAYNIICMEQYGFRKQQSTLTNHM